MATHTYGPHRVGRATADLSAAVGLAVRVGALTATLPAYNAITVPVTAGGRVDGFVIAPGAAGKEVTYQTYDVASVRAGAAVAAGAYLTVDITGRVVTAVATNHICGIARQPASGADVNISAELGYLGVL